MKRVWVWVLIFTALAGAEGCKRSRGGKREAVGVMKESDYIFAKKLDDDFQRLAPRGAEPEPPKADPDGEKLKRLQETFNLGQEFQKFCTATPVPDQSLDKFKTYLRRQSLTDMRRQVDSGEMLVFFISLPSTGQIIAMNKTAVDNNMYPFYLTGAGNADVDKPEKIEERIQNQELNVMWRYFCDYALGHFVNVPPSQPDLTIYNNIKAKTGSVPPLMLGQLNQTIPQHLIKQPSPRNLGAFKTYLKEKARPEVLAALESNGIRVNVNADLRLGNDLVACMKASSKGHPVITCDGNINYYPPEVVEPRFAQKQP